FLYIMAVITLITIMQVSECIAVIGKMQAGFKTASLPILIMIILVILVDYVDRFMLGQRAKEFANYLLLGMEKSKLSSLFLYEFFIIGIICFFIGAFIGTSIYGIMNVVLWHEKVAIQEICQSMLHTFAYFCIAEGVAALRIKGTMGRLQIRELMHEKERNQRISREGDYLKWGCGFTVCFICFLGMVWGIAFLPTSAGSLMISVIVIPLIGTIFMFYKFAFGLLYHLRQKQVDYLYQKDRIYIIGQVTSGVKTNAVLNGILCICILFSASSFVFGVMMLCPEVKIFDKNGQQWMGFLQVSICIIFFVIYFSILSLNQVIDLKQEARNLRVLHYMGKSSRQVRRLMKEQIAVRLFMPVIMAFVILLCSVPLLNLKLNQILPDTMYGILLKSMGGFAVCFLIFYTVYSFVLF
ncbi:MAG: hypothetical protein K2G39_09250, partial [Lachnospiraceae bacterium]|nr:hypothetical protein [Lachnospiraceae bacterium]